MAAIAAVGADVCSGGYSLNIAQRLAVSNALTKLKINEKLPHIAFWGKITGVSNDYLLAVAISSTSNIEKRFYFSVDSGITFARLPTSDEWVREKIRKVFSKMPGLLFTGQPAFLYKDPNQPVVDETEAKSPAGTPPQSPKPAQPLDPNNAK